MPIFKIVVTRNELNALLKEHPELVGRTSIDAPSDKILGKSFDKCTIDDSWTPTNESVSKSYELMKKRCEV